MTTGQPRYTVLIEPAARRKLANLPHSIQVRLVSKMESLADDPRGAGSIKLAGQDAYRVRVGDYRIIYAVVDKRLVVLVIDLGHRREIYKGR